MAKRRIAIIGAGIAGLTAAIDLAHAGDEVRVFDKQAAPGGKLRQVWIGGRASDAGPTVFTLRDVFDDLFAAAGDDFGSRLTLIPAQLLARHAWPGGGRFDLFADFERTVEAVGEFAGARDAAAYRRFAERAAQIYRTLERPFMRAMRPSMVQLARRVGLSHLKDLWNIQPFTTLWKSAGHYFEDARLRQLFARYATYCGSSPFLSPATLMLIAHVERAGVWYIAGGMHRLAVELASLAARKGAILTYGTEIVRMHVHNGRIAAVQTDGGERIAADAVICNGDTNAVACGMFGEAVRGATRATPQAARSLSAMTWNLEARTSGFELAHHSVFFSNDYRSEFDEILRAQRVPRQPTIYVCAQDRIDTTALRPDARERLLCLINAPAVGDRHRFDGAEMQICERKVFETLSSFGLKVSPCTAGSIATSPADFNRLFPGTGGALYGPASHGWMASFKRPSSRSKIPGLYFAGGSAHPGPGVPMAAISGRLAAASILADPVSIGRSRPAVTAGGMSMP